MQKLDIFNHIFPKPFYELMMKIAPGHEDMGKRVRGVPMLHDLDERFIPTSATARAATIHAAAVS